MRRVGVVLLWVALSLGLQAQDWRPLGPHVGLYVGYSFIDEQLENNGRYHPWLVMLQIQVPLSKNDRLSLFLEPQFNFATLEPAPSRYDEYEAGVNLGFRYAQPIGERTFAYGAISAGPHFITAMTRQQADGFIFSDNFTLGVGHQVAPNWQWQGAIRFRHLSNAGLQEPNLGLDNWFIVSGFSRQWQPNK